MNSGMEEGTRETSYPQSGVLEGIAIVDPQGHNTILRRA